MKKHFAMAVALIAVGTVGIAHAADPPKIKEAPFFAPPPPTFS